MKKKNVVLASHDIDLDRLALLIFPLKLRKASDPNLNIWAIRFMSTITDIFHLNQLTI